MERINYEKIRWYHFSNTKAVRTNVHSIAATAPTHSAPSISTTEHPADIATSPTKNTEEVYKESVLNSQLDMWTSVSKASFIYSVHDILVNLNEIPHEKGIVFFYNLNKKCYTKFESHHI